MHQARDTLSRTNVDALITEYAASTGSLGESIAKLKGLRLLEALKRDVVGTGPYPGVTLFEAANRIMSDLVILRGVPPMRGARQDHRVLGLAPGARPVWVTAR